MNTRARARPRQPTTCGALTVRYLLLNRLWPRKDILAGVVGPWWGELTLDRDCSSR